MMRASVHERRAWRTATSEACDVADEGLINSNYVIANAGIHNAAESAAARLPAHAGEWIRPHLLK